LVENKAVEENEAKHYAKENAMNFITTSAKTGENVEDAFKALIETILDELSEEK
jgi:GTPase SAR1 family protein